MKNYTDYYVDPLNITNYHRTKKELEAFWLFSIVVAGKNSEVQAKKLADFLYDCDKFGGPFAMIEHYIQQAEQMHDIYIVLRQHLENVKMGQYNRIVQSFYASSKLDISKASLQELESVHGVGPKTARFFLLHSRPHEELAVLDTHILKWFRDNGLDPNAPKRTPSGKAYLRLEKMFLKYAEDNKITPAELDLRIWTYYNTL